MNLFTRRTYTGPVSDHFDGTRFFNPGGEMPASLRQIWEWRRSGKAADWPASRQSPHLPDVPPQRVAGKKARVAAIGHASFLLQTGGLNILLDPVWSEQIAVPLGPKRHSPPGIAFADLPTIDVVGISHSHYDHMDRPTLKRLQEAHAPRFIVPLGCDALLARWLPGARISAHDWHEHIALGADIAVTLDATHHWSARGPFDRRRTLWASFAFETPAGLVYYVGDTGFHAGCNYRAARAKFGAPALSILPIGAYAPRSVMRPQHQDPDEAVRGALFLQSDLTLASHWGVFQLTDEAIDDPLSRLDAALAKWNVSPKRFLRAEPGAVVHLPSAIEAPLPQALEPTTVTTAPTVFDHSA